MAKILIADDTQLMRISLRRVLESAGHEVVAEAGGGEEAVKLYEKFKPDLVTLDVIMGEMDGIAALQAIRKLDPRAKVIMLTSIRDMEVELLANKLGAMGYIEKPFNPTAVIKEIERVLGGDNAEA
ncbi:MAG: response regulator [bacterium]